MAQSFEIGPFHFQTRPLSRVFYLEQAMTDRQQIDAEMERDIEVLGLTAPRVTPDQIEALMGGVRYEVQVVPGTTTTLATAIAANGFTLAIGMTACADPANFNAELGAKYAIKDAEAKARQELWKLEGYRLKHYLGKPVMVFGGDCMVSGTISLDEIRGVDGGSPKPSHIERMHQEQEQLAERTGKLETFIPSETFKRLPHQEQSLMKRQLVAMREYLAVLNERIAAATNP
ncbi:Gp49 family protein [Aeromonas sp. SG16]|uniref:Gp49 family protein n=1 Tax=Aeromonas sp. SG16 TaxID=2950548 RepID=UPI00210D02A5|nr:Gp49 family protein [Aeromonas sp. SG16]MCQ4052354.1 Gp49 family protein [Aeromonas sp. SG16]